MLETCWTLLDIMIQKIILERWWLLMEIMATYPHNSPGIKFEQNIFYKSCISFFNVITFENDLIRLFIDYLFSQGPGQLCPNVSIPAHCVKALGNSKIRCSENIFEKIYINWLSIQNLYRNSHYSCISSRVSHFFTMFGHMMS